MSESISIGGAVHIQQLPSWCQIWSHPPLISTLIKLHPLSEKSGPLWILVSRWMKTRSDGNQRTAPIRSIAVAPTSYRLCVSHRHCLHGRLQGQRQAKLCGKKRSASSSVKTDLRLAWDCAPVLCLVLLQACLARPFSIQSAVLTVISQRGKKKKKNSTCSCLTEVRNPHPALRIII